MGAKRRELLVLISVGRQRKRSPASSRPYWEERRETSYIQSLQGLVEWCGSHRPRCASTQNFCEMCLYHEFHKYLRLQFSYLEFALASQYSEEKQDIRSFYMKSLDIKHLLFSYLHNKYVLCSCHYKVHLIK